MTTTSSQGPKGELYLLGGVKVRILASGFHVRFLSNTLEVVKASKKAPRKSTWVLRRRELARALLQSIGRDPSKRLGNLILLNEPNKQSIASLKGLFDKVIGRDALVFLPDEELFEVLTAPEEKARNLFIAGSVDPSTKTVALVRGDLSQITVSLSLLKPTGIGLVPEEDPDKFAVIDYGHAIRMGDYEASADAILYEVDPKYRREIAAKRRAEDQSFGAALRRLRKQKHLRQSDFDPLPAKTIARIERNEVGKPQQNTLQTIAKRLGVEADEIETY